MRVDICINCGRNVFNGDHKFKDAVYCNDITSDKIKRFFAKPQPKTCYISGNESTLSDDEFLADLKSEPQPAESAPREYKFSRVESGEEVVSLKDFEVVLEKLRLSAIEGEINRQRLSKVCADLKIQDDANEILTRELAAAKAELAEHRQRWKCYGEYLNELSSEEFTAKLSDTKAKLDEAKKLNSEWLASWQQLKEKERGKRLKLTAKCDRYNRQISEITSLVKNYIPETLDKRSALEILLKIEKALGAENGEA